MIALTAYVCEAVVCRWSVGNMNVAAAERLAVSLTALLQGGPPCVAAAHR